MMKIHWNPLSKSSNVQCLGQKYTSSIQGLNKECIKKSCTVTGLEFRNVKCKHYICQFPSLENVAFYASAIIAM